KIWERFLEYELGHLQHVARLFEQHERRDASEIVPEKLPKAIQYVSHRDFVRETLEKETRLSAVGADFVARDRESKLTRAYRDHMNSEGSPSDIVAADYVWQPGTELAGHKGGQVKLPASMENE